MSLLRPRLIRQGLFFITACLCLELTAEAQVRVLSNAEPPRVFSGEGGQIPVVLRNDGGSPQTLDLRFRLFQTTSATAVLVSEARWKEIQVLPGQTVLETAAVDFPAIRVETRFLLQWLDAANTVIGSTKVRVYPPDLLKDLKPLVGEAPLGVFDPQDQLKPLLRSASIEFLDLETSNVENFPGKLAIVGPFRTRDQIRPALPEEIKALSRKHVGVVWIAPPAENDERPKPSFYLIPEGKGAMLVAQASELAGLPDDPQAHLRLIYFAQGALRAVPFPVPDLNPPSHP